MFNQRPEVRYRVRFHRKMSNSVNIIEMDYGGCLTFRVEDGVEGTREWAKNKELKMEQRGAIWVWVKVKENLLVFMIFTNCIKLCTSMPNIGLDKSNPPLPYLKLSYLIQF